MPKESAEFASGKSKNLMRLSQGTLISTGGLKNGHRKVQEKERQNIFFSFVFF